ncbi:hypothetical protein BK659_21880 [Pseudomonas brassicacearum]|uniref:RHS repeat-associated core domain-containing protein n=2 Tax=Pseudomonas brassicacearum TaxID=930166 RepID=A0A423H0U8_9PSED|nr:hypothetical protein BK659_21880 [Pseudomonas brassicacearum]
MDPRGLAIRSVGYCRQRVEQAIDTRITRQIFDAAGRLSESWDPRLWGVASKPNLATVYDLTGQSLLTDSVDGGWQLGLLDETGQLLSSWDSRGSQRHTDYDGLQRPVAITEQASDEPPRIVERLSYGGSDEGFAEHNQCGQVIRHDDPAGTQVFTEYGLNGLALSESRRVLADLETPNWPLTVDARDALLEETSFVTTQTCNPLGELQTQSDAKRNVRTFAHTVAGELKAVWLKQAASNEPQLLVSHIRYNAFGQIDSETAGNGVVTNIEYAADNGRLIRLVAGLAQQKPLQDLNYAYDPVGNIVELEDQAQTVSHFNHQRIEPINRYRYDSLYQLVEAKGWEVSSPSHGPALPAVLPTPLDPNQRRTYTQTFDYDRAGNLITRHHSGAPSFSMFTSSRSDRSLGQRDDGGLPGEEEIAQSFDANGNQQELQRGQTMSWDTRNQLSRVTLVKRDDGPDDDEHYVYDRPGHRLRKVRLTHTGARTLRAEVRYLPGLDIHRDADGEEHHVISVDAGRSSVRVLHWPSSAPEGVDNDQQRYSLSDHLGSSTLELDDQAGVLTQEHYYPFGGTACWAGKSAVAAKYKTIRYSGKERDATGLYYYGYRYYAPWLQRWICPDPAGDRDGLNRYEMVGNNPINLIDRFGLEGERALGTQMLGGIIIMILLAMIGAGLGWLAGDAGTGAAIGALLGGALYATSRWHDYQQSRPESIAAKTEEVQRQFGEAVTNLAIGLATQGGLTHNETSRLVTFAYERRNAHGSDGVAINLFNTAAGRTYGYVGPAETGRQAQQILHSDKNPVRALKQLGHSSLLLRDTPREQSPTTTGSTNAGQFEVGVATRVTSRRGGGRSSPPGTSSIQPQRMGPASAENWDIDTREVDTILGDLADPRSRSISLAIGHVNEGRTGAVNWHRHSDGLWSADLHGFPGNRGRGAHRLMFEHLGGPRYKVVGIRDPHSR